MSHSPREVLNEIVARHGDAMLRSPLRCEGLLKDYCGEYRREIFVLTSCLRVGLVEQMRRQSGPSIKLICARLALKLEQNLAISSDVAKWGVESWAVALGLMKPENATITLVEQQHFNPSDISVAAQIERIKASGAQAMIAWTTGVPVATVFKGMIQAGLDIPVGISSGNQVFPQMEQFAAFLPKQALIGSAPKASSPGLRLEISMAYVMPEQPPVST